jgi:porphobilinogen deaminase
MRALNAGCTTPLGARAVCLNGRLHMWAAIISIDGKKRVFAEDEDAAQNSQLLGERIAQRLQEMGASDLMVS